MNASDAGTVVVGVDGSTESQAALIYAMDDAARRGARLRVVAALARPDYWVTAYGPVLLYPSAEEVERVRAAARQWIDDVTAGRPHDAVPAPIEVSAVPGPAAEALIAAARDADLLVLGHRGRGAVAGLLLGSVGMRCVADAPCPVTVVQPAPVVTVAADGPDDLGSTRPAERRTKVSEVMTTDVLSVPADATFAQIAGVLSTGRVRAVPVVDAAGVLLGTVSEADLLVAAERAEPPPERPWWRSRPRHTGRTRPRNRPGATTAAELMSRPVVTVEPGTTVARAARAMRERGLSWLPVVEPSGRVVGVVGRSDLLSVFQRDDAGIRAEIFDDVLGRLFLVGPERVSVRVVDGVVTLDGEVDTRADAELAVRFAERVEGVVAVVDRLRFRVDDRAADLSEVRRY